MTPEQKRLVKDSWSQVLGLHNGNQRAWIQTFGTVAGVMIEGAQYGAG